ncbi:NCS2 family permease [uncultured Sphingomonas sp.]|uniref:NCS2 family permease n=1 Tax=uncultured Sphingomonas sp. TaxID=158754 RepID=UPI0035CAA28A
MTGIEAALDRRFLLAERGTGVGREALAGLTSFLAAAYLIVVIPSLLAQAGIDRGGATTAAILLIAGGSIAMGLYANLPFLVGPGIGGSALIGVTLAQVEHIDWPAGLGIALFSGLLFVVLTLSGARGIVVRIIPTPIKLGLGASIGLFIAMLGCRDAGMIAVNAKTNALALGNFALPGPIMALTGLGVALAMQARRLPGAILAGIAAAAVLGVPLGVTKLAGSPLALPHSLAPVALHLDPVAALRVSALPYLFAFFAAEFFSTLGTTLAIGGKAGLTDADGDLPGIQRPFLVDAVSASIGPLIGIPAATALVESAAGVEAGGRTGLTPIVAAGLFLLTLAAVPLAMAIPRQATAPALILIGVSLPSTIRGLPGDEPTALFAPIAMVLTTLIANSFGTGIAAGTLLYVVIELLAGRGRTLHPGLVAMAVPLGYYLYVAATPH